MKKLTVSSFRKMKEAGEKIVMVTAYDAPTAAMAYEAGVEMLLVGDSLGMAVLGYKNTLPVTMEDMLHHCKAVRRGAPEAFVVGDMTFMSYQISTEEALHNAARLMKEAGCNAVKLEGGAEYAPLVGRLAACGIPVVAHAGLLPQKVEAMGGYRVQGKTEEAARQLLADAHALEDAGAFALVLECIPAALAEKISGELTIPTIGIGAGIGCNGQVQVIHDILGMSCYLPKHAKCYADAGSMIRKALGDYVAEVKAGSFPGPGNSF
ncbi:MAG: 3-methyl-2-oxobutanoate hydroxymethyltransferase [Lentisphaeria bacterium]|nr:3-methyl-2-oxobutanoate hydroxymethyltransferase [Lentisphaeria bacterium]MBR2642659.1 3-methyl-2-oxobutanoate hydroxymethyltransferase [Lentisphaeria bacterium]